MSYPKPNTGNSMNDYFSALSDFVMLSPRLLEAETEQGFVVWFEKLLLIDRRSLLIFLRQHKDEIRPEFMEFARLHFEDYEI